MTHTSRVESGSNGVAPRARAGGRFGITDYGLTAADVSPVVPARIALALQARLAAVWRRRADTELGPDRVAGATRAGERVPTAIAAVCGSGSGQGTDRADGGEN